MSFRIQTSCSLAVLRTEKNREKGHGERKKWGTNETGEGKEKDSGVMSESRCLLRAHLVQSPGSTVLRARSFWIYGLEFKELKVAPGVMEYGDPDTIQLFFFFLSSGLN